MSKLRLGNVGAVARVTLTDPQALILEALVGGRYRAELEMYGIGLGGSYEIKGRSELPEA